MTHSGESDSVAAALRQALSELRERERLLMAIKDELARTRKAIVGLERMLSQLARANGTSPSSTPRATAPPRPAGAPSARSRVEEWCKSKPGERFTVKELAADLAIPAGSASAYLSEVLRAGIIERVMNGMYRVREGK